MNISQPIYNYPIYQLIPFKSSSQLKEDNVDNVKKELPSFADINMIGKCNLRCFFCVGRELSNEALKHGRNINVDKNIEKPFQEWPNFAKFLKHVKDSGIKKLYLTGSNTDPSQYKYLAELIDYLKSEDFIVGIRTNGYFDEDKVSTILQKLNGKISYSVQSLNPSTNKKICGESKIPNWDKIIPKSGDNCRVTMVVNRYNCDEVIDTIKYFSKFDNIKYIQLRSIYAETDKFKNKYIKDREAFDKLKLEIASKYEHIRDFKGCPIYNIAGKEVSLWNLSQNTVNACNYYTDGVYHDDYYVVKGYSKSVVNKENMNVLV